MISFGLPQLWSYGQHWELKNLHSPTLHENNFKKQLCNFKIVLGFQSLRKSKLLTNFQFWPSSICLGNGRKFYHSVSFLTSSKRLVRQAYHYSGVFFMNHTANNENICNATFATPFLLINRHKWRANGLIVKKKSPSCSLWSEILFLKSFKTISILIFPPSQDQRDTQRSICFHSSHFPYIPVQT